MTNQIYNKLFERVITMSGVSEQIRTAVSLIPGVKVFEEISPMDGEHDTWIISFEVPNKGCWMAFTTLDKVLDGRTHVLLYHLRSRISFNHIKLKAIAKKQDFPYTFFETCEQSPKLIKAYSEPFTSFELPYFINNINNV